MHEIMWYYKLGNFQTTQFIGLLRFSHKCFKNRFLIHSKFKPCQREFESLLNWCQTIIVLAIIVCMKMPQLLAPPFAQGTKARSFRKYRRVAEQFLGWDVVPGHSLTLSYVAQRSSRICFKFDRLVFHNYTLFQMAFK